jgi:hypothetical protein
MSVLLAASLQLFFLPSLNLTADEVTAAWNGSTGLWDTPSSWSTGTIPNNYESSTSYRVKINSGTVMVDSGLLDPSSSPIPITIDSIKSAGTLESNGVYPFQTLNVTGSFINSGIVKMDSNFHYLNVGGNFINSGQFTTTDTTIGGNLFNSGEITLDKDVDSTLKVNGTLFNAGGLMVGDFDEAGILKLEVGQLQTTSTGGVYRRVIEHQPD